MAICRCRASCWLFFSTEWQLRIENAPATTWPPAFTSLALGESMILLKRFVKPAMNKRHIIFLSHLSQVCYLTFMELKSKREAAELLGVSTRGIERAVRRGHLNVVYHDSKHGKKAWFSPADLERYRQQQQARGPVGFMTGSGGGPTIGTVIPMVDMQPRAAAEAPRRMAKTVPIVDRLTLTLAEAVQLSGLPRKFLVESVRSGALKSVKIGRIAFIKRIDLNEFVHSL